uniref:Uncharacterized protein n=1 Tax=Leersia perrieri TaxID=77586 RepID=A0A0D9V4D2_9ORYZ
MTSAVAGMCQRRLIKLRRGTQGTLRFHLSVASSYGIKNIRKFAESCICGLGCFLELYTWLGFLSGWGVYDMDFCPIK